VRRRISSCEGSSASWCPRSGTSACERTCDKASKVEAGVPEVRSRLGRRGRNPRRPPNRAPASLRSGASTMVRTRGVASSSPRTWVRRALSGDPWHRCPDRCKRAPGRRERPRTPPSCHERAPQTDAQPALSSVVATQVPRSSWCSSQRACRWRDARGALLSTSPTLTTRNRRRRSGKGPVAKTHATGLDLALQALGHLL